MVEDLFVLEHLVNSDHNIITLKQLVKQLLIKILEKLLFFTRLIMTR